MSILFALMVVGLLGIALLGRLKNSGRIRSSRRILGTRAPGPSPGPAPAPSALRKTTSGRPLTH